MAPLPVPALSRQRVPSLVFRPVAHFGQAHDYRSDRPPAAMHARGVRPCGHQRDLIIDKHGNAPVIIRVRWCQALTKLCRETPTVAEFGFTPHHSGTFGVVPASSDAPVHCARLSRRPGIDTIENRR